MSSTTSTTPERARRRRENPIPPWERIAVDAGTAAAMLSIGKSTFFKRVASKQYPQPRPDGLWNVSDLRAIGQPAETEQ